MPDIRIFVETALGSGFFNMSWFWEEAQTRVFVRDFDVHTFTGHLYGDFVVIERWDGRSLERQVIYGDALNLSADGRLSGTVAGIVEGRVRPDGTFVPKLQMDGLALSAQKLLQVYQSLDGADDIRLMKHLLSEGNRIGAGPMADRMVGYDGNDTLLGKSGNDYLYGGRGDDRLFGDGDHDWIYGGLGRDTLEAGSGADRMSGGGGADVFVFRPIPYDPYDTTLFDFQPGRDVIVFKGFGDVGFDNLIFSYRSGLTVNLYSATDGSTEFTFAHVLIAEISAQDFIFA